MKAPHLLKKIILSLPFVLPYLERRAYKRQIEAICTRIEGEVLEDARRVYAKEQPTCATWEEYLAAFEKHRVEYSEFFHQSEFWKKSDEEIEEFVIETKLRQFYHRNVAKEVINMFWSKANFLRAFPEYIHRRWLLAREASFEEFKELVLSTDCIAKPNEDCSGRGFFKITGSELSDVNELYEHCARENLLIEECISGCPELQQFHPQSLNSIRVVTIANGTEGEVFGGLLRMGVGKNVVDNAHSNGLFATIDVETGIVDSDGINVFGGTFSTHPDTGVPIKGFRIPEWERIKATCIQATMKYKNVFIVGWDVALNPQHEIIIIEGNHAPGFAAMQSPRRVGERRRLQQIISKYHGNRYKLP